MKCEKCHNHEATVYITQYVNGEAMEMHLCENCAAETSHNIVEEGLSFQQFLSGLIENNKNIARQANAPTCPSCGMSLIEFKKHSKVGCADCYRAFGNDLKPIIKRLHGTTRHTGKQPGRISESLTIRHQLEAMQEQLNQALVEENYEEAARLRDAIKAFKKEAGI